MNKWNLYELYKRKLQKMNLTKKEYDKHLKQWCKDNNY